MFQVADQLAGDPRLVRVGHHPVLLLHHRNRQYLDPSQTRRKLAEALGTAPAGRGRHGNIPV
jgi:hypothetical protein